MLVEYGGVYGVMVDMLVKIGGEGDLVINMV